jgi:hypothetical protein
MKYIIEIILSLFQNRMAEPYICYNKVYLLEVFNFGIKHYINKYKTIFFEKYGLWLRWIRSQGAKG